MPDLRESSPSKISSGFGGTLSLVISSLFIMSVVVVAAVPTHLFLISNTMGSGVVAPNGILAWAGGPWGATAGVILVVILGLTATFVPLVLGLRAFRRLEV
jgi:hypothetical protein